MSSVHYQRVRHQSEAVKRLHEHARAILPKGSMIVDISTMRLLGQGDPTAGEAVLHKMFKMAAPGAIHPDAVRAAGAGSFVKGRKVIQKFLDRAGTQPPGYDSGGADQQSEPGAEHSGGRVDWRGGDVHYEPIPLTRIVPQPDGHHGWSGEG